MTHDITPLFEGLTAALIAKRESMPSVIEPFDTCHQCIKELRDDSQCCWATGRYVYWKRRA